jgi:hypothetical protein
VHSYGTYRACCRARSECLRPTYDIQRPIYGDHRPGGAYIRSRRIRGHNRPAVERYASYCADKADRSNFASSTLAA